ncbi:MAG: SHOCT domain-containing protein [Deltaproteobacteria bacterium]|nr:SHOCT domain-containing protein [Deltaproteobacteria bacterium]
MRIRHVIVMTLVLGIPLTLGMSLAGKAAPKNTIYTDYRLNFVKLEALSGPDLKAKAPTHPAEVSTETMSGILSTFRLSRRALMKKGKMVDEREIFDEEAINVLAPHLVEGLRRAKEHEVVVFSYLYKNPKFILRNDRLTAGKMWMTGKDLHVEFLKVYAKVTGDLSKRGYSDKLVNMARGVRIVLEPAPGMTLGETAREVIADTGATFFARGRHTLPEQAPDRLTELKRLREMNLITEKEYQAKRRAILNAL